MNNSVVNVKPVMHVELKEQYTVNQGALSELIKFRSHSRLSWVIS